MPTLLLRCSVSLNSSSAFFKYIRNTLCVFASLLPVFFHVWDVLRLSCQVFSRIGLFRVSKLVNYRFIAVMCYCSIFNSIRLEIVDDVTRNISHGLILLLCVFPWRVEYENNAELWRRKIMLFYWWIISQSFFFQGILKITLLSNVQMRKPIKPLYKCHADMHGKSKSNLVTTESFGYLSTKLKH
jgi:hypothetical protein